MQDNDDDGYQWCGDAKRSSSVRIQESVYQVTADTHTFGNKFAFMGSLFSGTMKLWKSLISVANFRL